MVGDVQVETASFALNFRVSVKVNHRHSLDSQPEEEVLFQTLGRHMCCKVVGFPIESLEGRLNTEDTQS